MADPSRLSSPRRPPLAGPRLSLPPPGPVSAGVGPAVRLIRRVAAGRARVVGIVAAVAVAGGLGAATAVRNQVWQSALALWADASEKSPQKPRIWVNYGTALHFAGRYEEKALRRWLRVFVERFFDQQFKRSVMPDGPKVGSVSLSPRADWRMPSDASKAARLRELE